MRGDSQLSHDPNTGGFTLPVSHKPVQGLLAGVHLVLQAGLLDSGDLAFVLVLPFVEVLDLSLIAAEDNPLDLLRLLLSCIHVLDLFAKDRAG